MIHCRTMDGGENLFDSNSLYTCTQMLLILLLQRTGNLTLIFCLVIEIVLEEISKLSFTLNFVFTFKVRCYCYHGWPWSTMFLDHGQPWLTFFLFTVSLTMVSLVSFNLHGQPWSNNRQTNHGCHPWKTMFVVDHGQTVVLVVLGEPQYFEPLGETKISLK